MQTAMDKRELGLRIPMLDKEHYFHWKVKMHMHLLSIDAGYIDCIEKGPHVPMKVNTTVGTDGNNIDQQIPKPVIEYNLEDEKEVHRDKKTMNILFNGLDADMFDNVINCTTSKQVWDTVRVLCEGT